ncbi:MAG: cytochrome c oxidase assembly protein [Anaerolineae bacterium]|jgi:cytochrome c oxidase assembly factor CtaG
MDPTLSVVLLSWAWQPEIILTVGLAATIHLVGRWRLQRQSRAKAPSPWRTVSYLAGLAVLWVALMSPIDVLSDQFFYMHMVQHLLLVMIAPPLLLLADPMSIMLWGLPRGLRLEVGRNLRPDATFRRVVRSLTTPGLVWLYYVAVLIGWHEPRAYDLTLQSELVHNLEHLSFFITAMLFWWHVIGCAPHIHRRLSRGVRIGFVISAVPPTALTGVALSFASEPLYMHYTVVPRLGELTVMQDQMLGGVIMWIPGSMMFLIAALILLARAIREEERKEPLTPSPRTGEGGERAAGLDEQEGTAVTL